VGRGTWAQCATQTEGAPSKTPMAQQYHHQHNLQSVYIKQVLSAMIPRRAGCSCQQLRNGTGRSAPRGEAWLCAPVGKVASAYGVLDATDHHCRTSPGLRSTTRVGPAAQLETSEIVSPAAALLRNAPPPSEVTDPPPSLVARPSNVEPQVRVLSYVSRSYRTTREPNILSSLTPMMSTTCAHASDESNLERSKPPRR
jgi:hypothetical protein